MFLANSKNNQRYMFLKFLGVYREVRNIIPDRPPGYENDDGEFSYIVIGFKSLDTSFSQVKNCANKIKLYFNN